MVCQLSGAASDYDCRPFLGRDGLELVAHLADPGRRQVAEDIPVEMHHAALPSRLGQVFLGAFYQAPAGIGNDQPYALEATVDD